MQSLKTISSGIPWWSRGWDLVLSLARPQILSLSRTLRSHSTAKSKTCFLGNSLAVQWLRPPSNAKVLGSIPDQGNRILQTVWHGQKQKTKHAF